MSITTSPTNTTAITSDDLLHEHYQRADRIMFRLGAMLFVASLIIALWYDTWGAALVIGGSTLVATFLLVRLAAGQVVTRIALGASLMVYSALHIHQAHGMIEFHFGIFAFMAALLYYRDWVPIVAAALTIAVHHLGLFALQDRGATVWVLPDADGQWWVIWLHALYVVLEAAALIWLSLHARRDAAQGLELVHSIRRATHAGHIDLSETTSGEGETLERYNGFIDTLRQLVEQSRTVSEQLYHHGQQLNESTMAISGELNQQREQINDVASATEELSQTAAALTASAENGLNTTAQVADDSVQALQASERNAQAFASLSDEIREAVTVINSLNDESRDIGRVLDVIRAVAEQTNLLALNAAIEAARAGEHGRGFAVVADEVRTLARQTQDSTREIGEIIEQLQRRSEQAVTAIESSEEQLTQCLDNNSNVLAVIRRTEAATESLQTINRGIVTATQDQGRAAEQINRAIEEILSSAERSTQRSQDAANAGQSLELLSEQLRDLLTRFR